MIQAIPHYWEMLIPKVDADTEVLKGKTCWEGQTLRHQLLTRPAHLHPCFLPPISVACSKFSSNPEKKHVICKFSDFLFNHYLIKTKRYNYSSLTIQRKVFHFLKRHMPCLLFEIFLNCHSWHSSPVFCLFTLWSCELVVTFAFSPTCICWESLCACPLSK